jgi:hypothetical protein
VDDHHKGCDIGDDHPHGFSSMIINQPGISSYSHQPTVFFVHDPADPNDHPQGSTGRKTTTA